MAGARGSGRRRKPLGLKLVMGSRLRPYDRRGRRVQPAVPPRPAGLDADDLARAHWDRLVKVLEPVGLHAMDGDALAMLCYALADGDRLREEFRKTQCRAILVETIAKGDGTVLRRPRANPLLRPLADNSRLVRQWLSEFGMTPATLERVPPAPLSDEPSALERLLRGP